MGFTETFWTKNPRHLSYNRLPLLADSVYDINYKGTGVTPQHTYPYRDPSKAGDIVFVKTDYLDWYLLNRVITEPITLVTGVSDLSPTLFACKRIIENPLITKWIGCNITVSHPKILKMPIGVGEPERVNGNHETLQRLHNARVPWEEKEKDVCVPWYTKENHPSRTFPPTLPELEFDKYMEEISKHQFVVCPRGNGLDTHRVCEALLMGSVPVIEHSGLDDMYSQWPCLLVDSLASIKTDDFVWDSTKYDAFLDIFWLREGFLRQYIPKVLVLVLASDNAPVYLEHQRLWRTYMHNNPRADCFFYKGDPSMTEEARLEGDTLWIKIEDTLDTVYEKTLRAFDFFSDRFPQYKCIFRPNLSSVVSLKRYVEYCMSVPSESFCSAHIGGEDGFQYPGGAGYTITPDIAMKLVKERPPLITQDDVSLGHALKNWNIPICLAKRIDVLSIPHYQVCKMRGIPEDVFHFRLKQNTRHDGGSEIDTELKLMEQVIAEFCGKAFRVDHT